MFETPIKKVNQKLIASLAPEEVNSIRFFQVILVVSALLETITILSIGPFIAVNADIYSSENYQLVYETVEKVIPAEFLLLILVTFSCTLALFTQWRIAVLSQIIGANMSNRLFQIYLRQNWSFHKNTHSSKILAVTGVEVGRVTNQILMQVLILKTRIAQAVLILSGLMLVAPLVTPIIFLVFASFYTLVYVTIKSRLSLYGRIVTDTNGLRLKIIQEYLNLVKNISLSKLYAKPIDEFEKVSNKFGRSQGLAIALSNFPRYFLELIIFVSIIVFVVQATMGEITPLIDLLPVASIVFLASMRLIPAFQQIYTAYSMITSNQSALDLVHGEFKRYSKSKVGYLPTQVQDNLSIESIELKNIELEIDGQQILRNISLRIKTNEMIGIMGPSGAGKSSMVDVICGLERPSSGRLLVNSEELTENHFTCYQRQIGLVPQRIEVLDASVEENIALCLPRNKISKSRIQEVLNLAQLTDTFSATDEAKLGQAGTSISGGQIQRLGVARALYSDPAILVLDEATSALDRKTEISMMNMIEEIKGKKTIIIIAHKTETLKICDKIILMNNGLIQDAGTYDEFASKSYFGSSQVKDC